MNLNFLSCVSNTRLHPIALFLVDSSSNAPSNPSNSLQLPPTPSNFHQPPPPLSRDFEVVPRCRAKCKVSRLQRSCPPRFFLQTVIDIVVWMNAYSSDYNKRLLWPMLWCCTKRASLASCVACLEAVGSLSVTQLGFEPLSGSANSRRRKGSLRHGQRRALGGLVSTRALACGGEEAEHATFRFPRPWRVSLRL
jgi:hypothetical protein